MLRAALGLIGFSALVACSSGGDAAGASTSALAEGANDGESCQATLHFLQKDAYANYAGRRSTLLPPHTTTRVVVECTPAQGGAAETVAVVDHENHGTPPDKKDDRGRTILDETAHRTVKGTRAELTALADSLRDCSCDGPGGTKFLNADARDDGLLAAVAQELSGGTGCTDLVRALLTPGEDLGDRIAGLAEGCHPPPPNTLSSIFARAVSDQVTARGDVPSAYHVCNNDAKLQTELFTSFERTHVVGRCASTSDVCKGPSFRLDPPASTPAAP